MQGHEILPESSVVRTPCLENRKHTQGHITRYSNNRYWYDGLFWILYKHIDLTYQGEVIICPCEKTGQISMLIRIHPRAYI